MTKRAPLSQIIAIYTTWPDAECANSAARAILEAHLAACANILPAGTSLYWWEGAIQTASEVVMILKTTADQLETLSQKLQELHPYEVPAILSFPMHSHIEAYAAWVKESVLKHGIAI